MAETPSVYFIRVNGETLHNNPATPTCYVAGEPPKWPTKYFNYVDYCLTNGIVRIGWPGTGDLRAHKVVPISTPCYSNIEPHIRTYLAEFRDIAQGSVVLMPDKDRTGMIYIGTTLGTYSYSHNVPRDPYECSHRISMKWDKKGEHFVEYDAISLDIKTRGGFWTRAFHRIDRSQTADFVQGIADARKDRNR